MCVSLNPLFPRVSAIIVTLQQYQRNISSDSAHRQQLNSGVEKVVLAFWINADTLGCSSGQISRQKPPLWTLLRWTRPSAGGWLMAENVQLQRCGAFCKYRWTYKEQNAWSEMSGGPEAFLSSLPFLSLRWGRRSLRLTDVSSYVLTSGSN